MSDLLTLKALDGPLRDTVRNTRTGMTLVGFFGADGDLTAALSLEHFARKNAVGHQARS